MTTSSPSILRSALRLMSIGRVAVQLGLALLVFLLAVLWLRNPDASILEVIGSALFGLIVLAIAGAGQARILLHLTGQPAPWRKLARGALLVLACIGLSLGWRALLAHWHVDDYEAAGYLNSRFPQSLRRYFTFEHIALWIGWIWTMLDWFGIGILAIFAFAFTASRRPARAVFRALRSLTCWAALLIGTACATAITAFLVNWTPGHGLGIELTSLILRLGAAILLDVTVFCFLLAILAACIKQSDARYDTPSGTPDVSHPRTVDEP